MLSWNVTWRAPGALNLPDLIRALLLFAIKDKLCNTQCQCFEWISCTQWLCLLMLPVRRYRFKLILSCLNGTTGTRPKAYQESEPHVMQGLDVCFGSKGQQSQCCSQSMCSLQAQQTKGQVAQLSCNDFPGCQFPLCFGSAWSAAGNGAGKALHICINRLLPCFGYKIKGKNKWRGERET